MATFVRSLLKSIRGATSNGSADATVAPSAPTMEHPILLPRDERLRSPVSPANSSYDGVFDNVNDGIFIHDLAGHLLQVNRVVCEWLGYTRAELLQMRVQQLETPEKAAGFDDAIRAIERKGSLLLESCHRRKDGGWIPVEINARRIEYCGQPAILSVARDISERRRAEEALRQAEEKYRQIFENAIEGIFQSTPEGRFLSVNPAMASLYGYSSPADMIGSIGDEIEHRVHVWPHCREDFKRILEEKGLVRDFEAPTYRKDGSQIWTRTNARAVRDANGVVLYYEGFVEDTTECVRSEQALKESEERFRAQYRGIPIPTYTWKRTGQDYVLTDYNDAASDLTAGRVSTLLGKTASELYAEEPDIRQDIERCFRDRCTFQREISPRLRSANRSVDLIASYTFIPPDIVMVLTIDVTERNSAFRALQDSEMRYRMLMEQAPDGIAILDAQGKTINVNSIACEMLGYGREELLSMTLADLVAPGELERSAVRLDLLRDGKMVVAEWVMRRKDGTLFPAEVNMRMLPDGGIQGIVRDTSERKRLEEERQHRNRELETLYAQVQEMLSTQRRWNATLEEKVEGKTSELRALAETRDRLLRQMMTAQEEERRRVARELHDETSQALTALIANLGTLRRQPPSQVQCRLDEIRSSVVDILRGINRIVLDLRPTLLDDYGLMPALGWYAEKRLGSDGIRVETSAWTPDMRLPATVETVLFRIGQEAITNAARHAKASRVRVNLRSNENRDRVTLEIEDDGIGFDEAQVQRDSLSDRARLGLLGMRERVQLIGGELRVQSERGRGTLISVTVPLGEFAVEQ